MQQPNRNYTSASYRYGFQGQEKDDELKGEGNSVNYKYRIHDPRVGRFFSVDPLSTKYPMLTVYQFSANTPIMAKELEGLESSNDPNPTQKGPIELALGEQNKAGYGKVIQHNLVITIGHDRKTTQRKIQKELVKGNNFMVVIGNDEQEITHESSKEFDTFGPGGGNSEYYSVTLKVPYIASRQTQNIIRYNVFTAQVSSLDELENAKFKLVDNSSKFVKMASHFFGGLNYGLNYGLLANMGSLKFRPNPKTFKDFAMNPRTLYGTDVGSLQKILGKNWKKSKYGKTGDGWKLINEKHTNQMIFFNSNGKHGGKYWGISGFKKDGSGRIKVTNKNYSPSKDDPATIIKTNFE